MASSNESVEFDKTLHDRDVALDVLTDTLGGVAGCEYPRLLAREIQALIVACMAHDKVRQQTTANGRGTEETPDGELESPSRTAEMMRGMVRSLEAREAEITSLRDLLHHGIDTIESHTLTDPDGTAVMHGEYQCISASAVEQWVEQVEAALNGARTSTG